MRRASVPPERLLKASLLIALYSVRSERAFCEKLEYNLPYRWFLDRDQLERSFDTTVFTKNRARLLAHDADWSCSTRSCGRPTRRYCCQTSTRHGRASDRGHR
ncbi:MAG: transposase [Caldilineaceae bacterium SB0661_bin_34]|nr:transposase [Caldilineaceae bacterium SB0661_bin_34]